jgi:hypothetical protein
MDSWPAHSNAESDARGLVLNWPSLAILALLPRMGIVEFKIWIDEAKRLCGVSALAAFLLAPSRQVARGLSH